MKNIDEEEPIREINKFCRSCESEIPSNASVCKYCQREQSPFFLSINRAGGIVATLGLLGTLIGTYLAVTSAADAKADRLLAESSYEKALATESRVETVVVELETTKANLYAAIGDIYGEMQVGIQQEWTVYKRICSEAGGRRTGQDCATQMASILETMDRAYQRHDSINIGVAKIAGVDADGFMKLTCWYISQMSPDDEYRRYTNLPKKFEDSIDTRFVKFAERCSE